MIRIAALPRLATAFAVTLGLASGVTSLTGGARQAWAQTAPNPSFNLINKSSQDIKELYASSAGVGNWGPNRVAGKTVAAGASFAVRLPANGTCRYDIRVVTVDGKVEEKRAIDTCNTDDVMFSGSTVPVAAPSGPPAPGSSANLRLTNNGASAIKEFYARHRGATDWGLNRLETGAGKPTIAPGATLVLAVPFDGSCIFELRVVFEPARAREKKGVDLCKTTDIPVN